MATLIRYFRPDSTSGGDGTVDTTAGANRAYATMQDALSSEEVDLVAAGDILHLICTQPGVDTEIVDNTATDNYVTGASNYIIVECQGSARNNGVSREKSGAGYQLKTTGAPFDLELDFIRVVGIEFTSITANATCISGPVSGAISDIRWDDCLFTNTMTATGTVPLIDVSNVGVFKFTNCLAIGDGYRAIDIRGCTAGSFINHCGFAGDGSHGVLADPQCDIQNTWSIGHTTLDFFDSGGGPTGSNNASEDTSATDNFTSSVSSITPSNEFTSPTFVPSTFDYTLLDGVLDAAGTGSEPEDIADATRTDTADIGPFNFGGGAPGGSSALLLQQSSQAGF